MVERTFKRLSVKKSHYFFLILNLNKKEKRKIKIYFKLRQQILLMTGNAMVPKLKFILIASKFGIIIRNLNFK
jgi:hypothetical protein